MVGISKGSMTYAHYKSILVRYKTGDDFHRHQMAHVIMFVVLLLVFDIAGVRLESSEYQKLGILMGFIPFMASLVTVSLLHRPVDRVVFVSLLLLFVVNIDAEYVNIGREFAFGALVGIAIMRVVESIHVDLSAKCFAICMLFMILIVSSASGLPSDVEAGFESFAHLLTIVFSLQMLILMASFYAMPTLPPEDYGYVRTRIRCIDEGRCPEEDT